MGKQLRFGGGSGYLRPRRYHQNGVGRGDADCDGEDQAAHRRERGSDPLEVRAVFPVAGHLEHQCVRRVAATASTEAVYLNQITSILATQSLNVVLMHSLFLSVYLHILSEK